MLTSTRHGNVPGAGAADAAGAAAGGEDEDLDMIKVFNEIALEDYNKTADAFARFTRADRKIHDEAAATKAQWCKALSTTAALIDCRMYVNQWTEAHQSITEFDRMRTAFFAIVPEDERCGLEWEHCAMSASLGNVELERPLVNAMVCRKQNHAAKKRISASISTGVYAPPRDFIALYRDLVEEQRYWKLRGKPYLLADLALVVEIDVYCIQLLTILCRHTLEDADVQETIARKRIRAIHGLELLALAPASTYSKYEGDRAFLLSTQVECEQS